MDNVNLVQDLEHTAARLLIAAEQDRANREDLRNLAAQLQVMTDTLAPDSRA